MMRNLLWLVRRKLILWLAGSDTVLVNVRIVNGMVMLNLQDGGLISGCTFRCAGQKRYRFVRALRAMWWRVCGKTEGE